MKKEVQKINSHTLKILPKYFDEVVKKRKACELRKNDRDFRVGDALHLREFNNGEFTGRECSRVITHILRDCEQYGLKRGFVILSMTPHLGRFKK
ncbi:DUF3850 domain-containing protein [Sediminitomix flava]|uniref:Uncharacterized protein DUF3850 n=1 Tax=Sediminitomix flava TaxID=379075 RepID=A0A315Z950_SEDFL|nr:DUF3850 domain-containing protein [Sediminitomix flava]PWJ41085.1 uncharacterized protein DUF3850 [Sediminitomix flava]